MLVGLTGAIGAGKSTLARLLAQRGAAVVDADRVAHAVIERPILVQQLQQAFGRDIVGPDGSLNRREIGRRAFADPVRRERLNQIVRQPLEEAIWQAVDAAASSGADPVVVDAPLILEWGIDDRFDVLVVVAAREETCRARAAARGMGPAEFEARAAGQLPPEEKVRRADIVIDNDGDAAALEAQVDELLQSLASPG